MIYISGKILTEDGFKKGYIAKSKSNKIEIRWGNPQESPLCKGIIVPSFINAHTHIGDAFIRKQQQTLPKNIEHLVAPPNGLKHRLLKSVDDTTIRNGMIEAIQQMQHSGTSLFYDFRENGLSGIRILKQAIQQSHTHVKTCILGRPNSLNYDGKELDELLIHTDGIGLSSISDWGLDEVKEIAERVHKKEKIFSIHASERRREDMDKILDLNPHFLIHCNQATASDLKKIKSHNIPIVVCPQSNNYFDITLHLDLMKKVGNTILLGTDNAMLQQPNILDEVRCIQSMFPSLFSVEELLHMITFKPRKVLNSGDSIPESTLPESYLVLHHKTLQILYRLIKEG